MAILALGGCQEQILDRPLVKEKGVYTGQIDQDLTDDQVDALRRRGELQGF